MKKSSGSSASSSSSRASSSSSRASSSSSSKESKGNNKLPPYEQFKFGVPWSGSFSRYLKALEANGDIEGEKEKAMNNLLTSFKIDWNSKEDDPYVLPDLIDINARREPTPKNPSSARFTIIATYAPVEKLRRMIYDLYFPKVAEGKESAFLTTVKPEHIFVIFDAELRRILVAVPAKLVAPTTKGVEPIGEEEHKDLFNHPRYTYNSNRFGHYGFRVLTPQQHIMIMANVAAQDRTFWVKDATDKKPQYVKVQENILNKVRSVVDLKPRDIEALTAKDVLFKFGVFYLPLVSKYTYRNIGGYKISKTNHLANFTMFNGEFFEAIKMAETKTSSSSSEPNNARRGGKRPLREEETADDEPVPDKTKKSRSRSTPNTKKTSENDFQKRSSMLEPIFFPVLAPGKDEANAAKDALLEAIKKLEGTDLADEQAITFAAGDPKDCVSKFFKKFFIKTIGKISDEWSASISVSGHADETLHKVNEKSLHSRVRTLAMQSVDEKDRQRAYPPFMFSMITYLAQYSENQSPDLIEYVKESCGSFMQTLTQDFGKAVFTPIDSKTLPSKPEHMRDYICMYRSGIPIVAWMFDIMVKFVSKMDESIINTKQQEHPLFTELVETAKAVAAQVETYNTQLAELEDQNNQMRKLNEQIVLQNTTEQEKHLAEVARLETDKSLLIQEASDAAKEIAALKKELAAAVQKKASTSPLSPPAKFSGLPKPSAPPSSPNVAAYNDSTSKIPSSLLNMIPPTTPTTEGGEGSDEEEYENEASDDSNENTENDNDNDNPEDENEEGEDQEDDEDNFSL